MTQLLLGFVEGECLLERNDSFVDYYVFLE